MKLELIPLLAIQRELHAIPRGFERFKAYIQTITGGTDDIVVPLVGMNPMGKEHVAALIETLLSWDAEGFAKKVLADLEKRLQRLKAELKVGLVLTDDLKGGWTNSYLTDATARFKAAYDFKHHWALVPIWTAQAWDAEKLGIAIAEEVYRTLYKKRHGLPGRLREMMQQEGLARLFAGNWESLEPEELEYSRELLETQLDSSHYPTCFACLYGDTAAAAVGYPSLGLPDRAGFIVAREQVVGLEVLDFL
jgi:hypothetical protein